MGRSQRPMMVADREVDSPSFSCMVREEDKTQPMTPNFDRIRPADPRIRSPDTGFEFLGTSPRSPSPADILFSNGKLLPQSFPVNAKKGGGGGGGGRIGSVPISPSTGTTRSCSATSSRSSSRLSSTATSRSSSTGSIGGIIGEILAGDRTSMSSEGAAMPKRVRFEVSPSSEMKRQQRAVPPHPAEVVEDAGGASRVRNARVTPEASTVRKGEPKKRGIFERLSCRECVAVDPAKDVANKVVRM